MIEELPSEFVELLRQQGWTSESATADEKFSDAVRSIGSIVLPDALTMLRSWYGLSLLRWGHGCTFDPNLILDRHSEGCGTRFAYAIGVELTAIGYTVMGYMCVFLAEDGSIVFVDDDESYYNRYESLLHFLRYQCGQSSQRPEIGELPEDSLE